MIGARAKGWASVTNNSAGIIAAVPKPAPGSWVKPSPVKPPKAKKLAEILPAGTFSGRAGRAFVSSVCVVRVRVRVR